MSRFLRMFVKSCRWSTNDIDVSVQGGQRSKNVLAHARHVHTSLISKSRSWLNFNTSLGGNLTNVATLEYFTLTVFSFVFDERCFSCLAWVFMRYHEDSRVLGIVAIWSTTVSICWTRGSEHLCIFVVSFLLCLVSVSVLERYRED